MPSPTSHGLAVDAKDAGVDAKHQIAPRTGELVQIQGRTVKEVEESVIAGRHQPQGAHDARDPHEIRACRHSREANGHP